MSSLPFAHTLQLPLASNIASLAASFSASPPLPSPEADVVDGDAVAFAVSAGAAGELAPNDSEGALEDELPAAVPADDAPKENDGADKPLRPREAPNEEPEPGPGAAGAEPEEAPKENDSPVDDDEEAEEAVAAPPDTAAEPDPLNSSTQSSCITSSLPM